MTEVIHCFSVCLPEARLHSLAYQCVRNAVVFPCREHRHQLVKRTAHCVITLVTSKGQLVHRACALQKHQGQVRLESHRLRQTPYFLLSALVFPAM